MNTFFTKTLIFAYQEAIKKLHAEGQSLKDLTNAQIEEKMKEYTNLPVPQNWVGWFKKFGESLSMTTLRFAIEQGEDFLANHLVSYGNRFKQTISNIYRTIF